MNYLPNDRLEYDKEYIKKLEKEVKKINATSNVLKVSAAGILVAGAVKNPVLFTLFPANVIGMMFTNSNLKLVKKELGYVKSDNEKKQKIKTKQK